MEGLRHGGYAATAWRFRAGARSGDGVTLNTARIQKAIDDCAAGGGTVRFAAGRYLTGTMQIKSHVTLRLDDQATLLGSTNAADYRNVDPFVDGNGHPMGYALIVATDADRVGIEGGGTIDGQGPKLNAHEKPYTIRPFLIRWVRCSDVAVRGVHLTNPGAWTLHFSGSKGIVVEGVTIRARDQKMSNNDGIDIDSSENVRVHHCDVTSGDDSLVIKSTGPKPSRDIVASDCKLSSHTNAIKLGTESYGGFADISISNCQITNTGMSGIALCARHVRGIKRENVQTTLLKPDARPTTVFIDVQDVTPANFTAESSNHK